MRKWVLAAVAALAAGQAEARTYTLTFIADQVPPSDFDYNSRTIVLDLPSIRNVSISQSYYSGLHHWDGIYDPPVVSLPIDPMGWAPTEFQLSTDSIGRITSLYFGWDDYLEGHIMTADWWHISYYPNSETLFETTGHWDVSPVPLPATAPMLLGAVGFLGWVRGRGSQRRKFQVAV